MIITKKKLLKHIYFFFFSITLITIIFLFINKIFFNFNFTEFFFNNTFSTTIGVIQNNNDLINISKELTCRELAAALKISKVSEETSTFTKTAIDATNNFYLSQYNFKKNHVNLFITNNCLEVIIEINNHNFATEIIKNTDPGLKAAVVGAAVISSTNNVNNSFFNQKFYNFLLFIFEKIKNVLEKNSRVANFFEINLNLDKFLTFKNVTDNLKSMSLKTYLERLEEIKSLSKDIIEIEKKCTDFYKLRTEFNIESDDYNSVLLTTAKTRALAIPLIKRLYILWLSIGVTDFSVDLLKQEFYVRKFCDDIFSKQNMLSNEPKSVSEYLKLSKYKLENYETIKERKLRLKK